MQQQEQPLILTRNSKYLNSLLIPEDGAAYIPDDTTTRCTLKSLTNTQNFNLQPLSSDLRDNGTQSGLFAFLTLTPLYVLGIHYRWQFSTNKFVVDTTLVPSQDFRKDFDYGRLVSRIVSMAAGTISTTNVALSGYFNAMTYDGSLSELLTNLYRPGTTTFAQFYSSMLGAQSNELDKVNDVFMPNGVAALALPNQFDLNFVRLSDSTPIIATGSNVISNEISSTESNLVYNITTTTSDSSYSVKMNIDVPPGVTAALTFYFKSLMAPGTFPKTTFNADFLDINGEVIHHNDGVFAVGSDNGTMSFVYSSTSNFATGVRIYSDTLGLTLYSSISINVVNGSYMGVNRPVTLVAYDGAVLNTLVKVSGMSNFEVIPNPDLFRNLQTTYGPYDPHAMNYVRMLLSQRYELGLRTVCSIPYYNQRVMLWKDMAKIDSNEHADAFDIGSLLRGIKRIAVPLISTIFPAAAPLAHGIGEVVEGMTNSASGRVNAASGRVYAMDEQAVAHILRLIDHDTLQSLKHIEECFSKLLALKERIADVTEKINDVEQTKNLDEAYQQSLNECKQINSESLKSIAAQTNELSRMLNETMENRRTRINTVLDTIAEDDGYVVLPDEQQQPRRRHTRAMDDDVTTIGTVTLSASPYIAKTLLHENVSAPIHNIEVGDQQYPVAVMFPCIENTELTEFSIYAALKGHHPELVNTDAPVSLTPDKHTVLNYTGNIPFNTTTNMTLVKVHNIIGNKMTTVLGKSVEGSSCWAAIFIASDPRARGISHGAITGAPMRTHSGVLTLAPNIAYYLKKKYCDDIGLPLIATKPTLKRALTMAAARDLLFDNKKEDLVINMYNGPVSYTMTSETTKAMDENTVPNLTPLQMAGETTYAETPDVNIVPLEQTTRLEQLGNNIKSVEKTPQQVGYRTFVQDEIKRYLAENTATREGIIAWLDTNELWDDMANLPVTDPHGVRFSRAVANISSLITNENNPVQSTTLTSTLSRAQKVLDNISKSSGGKINPSLQWIIDNGYRGPNQEQMAAFANNITPPPIGTNATVDLQPVRLVQRATAEERAAKNLQEQASIKRAKEMERYDRMLSQFTFSEDVKDVLRARAEEGQKYTSLELSAANQKFKASGLAGQTPQQWVDKTFNNLETLITKPQPTTIAPAVPKKVPLMSNIKASSVRPNTSGARASRLLASLQRASTNNV